MSQTKPGSLLAGRSSAALPSFPPWSMIVISVISVQSGAAVAKQLFEVAGPSGVVFLRTFLGALLFLGLWRPNVRGLSRRAYAQIALYGVVIGLNMLCFYATIDRIPLGIAVAIAFAGPLGVAVIGSRKAADLLWVALAAGGIILLSPFSNTSLDPIGIALAFLTALLWGTYILVTKRVGHVAHVGVVLPIASCVAALVALPFGISGAAHVLSSPLLIFLSLIVALLSAVVPFGLEFQALQRMSAYTAGLLLSLEPVVATVIGFLVLHEALDVREVLGILLVTMAAIGTARSSSHQKTSELPVKDVIGEMT
jgi:inner membrane transporter RhtA